MWGYERYAVEHIFGKESIGNLDDAFGSEMVTLEIVAYGQGPVGRLKSQHAHYLEEHLARYAVDDSAAAQCGHS